MKHKSALLQLFLIPVILFGLSACASSSGPKDREFTVEIENSQPVGGVQTLRVTQGDTVTIQYLSDEQAEIHVHGYDIESEVEANVVTTVTFEADASGRFAIELEDFDRNIAFLEVQPN